jgi:hypothetical protein
MIFLNKDQSSLLQKDFLLEPIEKKLGSLDKFMFKKARKSDDLTELNQTKLFVDKINAPGFSLTNLLKTHKFFQPSKAKLLPKTEYLSAFNVTIEDFDHKNLIIYSLINNKIYQAYLTILKDFEPYYKRSIELEKYPIKKKATQEDLINFVTNEVARNINLCIEFLKQVPGFSILTDQQFSQLIKKRVIDFHIITVSPMVRNGEFYVFMENGSMVSRRLISKARGKEKTDFKVETIENLNQMSLTDREKALLLVYIYTIPGIIFCIIN